MEFDTCLIHVNNKCVLVDVCSSEINIAAISDKCFVNNNDFPTHDCQIINYWVQHSN